MFQSKFRMGRGKIISPEIRKLIIEGYNQKKTSTQIGEELNVASSSVRNIISAFNKKGNVETSFQGRKSGITSRDCRILKKIVVANRRETAAGISSEWRKNIQKELSTETCRRTFMKMGYGFYKVTLHII